MRTRAHRPIRLLAAVAGLGLAGCQGSDLTLPADVSPASLEVVDGNGQVGTVNTMLPEPLVVRVLDAANQPVPKVTLRFETQVPAAEVVPPVYTTDSTGLAVVQVQLGSTEGVQTIEAFLAEVGGLRTTFALIAEPSQPPEDGGGDDDRGGGSADDDDGDEDGNGNRGRGRGQGNGNGGDDDD